MADKRSLELILHNEVQELLDNFASVMRVHVVFFGRDGEVLRQGRGEGDQNDGIEAEDVPGRVQGHNGHSVEGLPPDEFPKVGELKEASVLARKILRLTARVGG